MRGLRGRWFAVTLALVVAILNVGRGGTAADEGGDVATAGEITQVASGGDNSVDDQAGPPSVVQQTGLTAREMTVVLAIADGHTTADVAETLGIRARTVESHLLHVYQKLGIHSRVQLVRVLARAGHLRL